MEASLKIIVSKTMSGQSKAAAFAGGSVFGIELDAEFGQSFHWPGQHRFAATGHDWPLDQFGMIGHHLYKLIVAQVSASHIFSVCFLVGSQRVLRFQPGLS